MNRYTFSGLVLLLFLATACSKGTQNPAQGEGAPDSGDLADVPQDDTGPNEDANNMADIPDPPPDDETGVYRSGQFTATAAVDDAQAPLRRYTMTSDAPLRDNLPEQGRISFAEQDGQPLLRTGHTLFDALFAMAVEETRLASVSSISDFAFNQGAGVPCECFETGEKWNYVWTRDTAYAVDLGLAMIDPIRARNSLDFKLSAAKGGGPLQIVQDTGSGGSWPISTDRVVWAIGAWEVLKFLPEPERTQFRDKAYEAMVNTIEQDRAVAYDPDSGLYRGEQSFLDWREQSYPSWTAQDTVHIGMSRTLSTNVGHQTLLKVAAELAREKGLAQEAEAHQARADALAATIMEVLWLDDVGMLSTMQYTDLDPSVLYKYDLLGQSLAVLQGVVPDSEAKRMVAAYPHAQMGPPVLWPQQPLIPIYHNRGNWPFVTAYGLLAAREVGNDAVFDLDLESLVRGAALNLSNMENFEFLSQLAWVDDGEFSGPVINSRRQLWSVAGYIGAVVQGIFGVEANQEGLRARPFVTAALRRSWLGQTERAELRNLSYRGKRLHIALVLPPQVGDGEGGVYPIESVKLDGVEVGQDFLAADRLMDGSILEITFGAAPQDAQSATVVPNDGDFRKLFAPREPNLTSVQAVGGNLELTFDGAGEEGVVFNIYRDGQRVASGEAGPTWRDPQSGDLETRTHCYAVEAVFESSGNHSHHSRPSCFWGGDAERITDFDIHNFKVNGGYWGQTAGRAHYVDWGDPEHSLELVGFQPRWSGPHLIQLIHGNGAGPINSGITASVKRVSVEDVRSGQVVASEVVTMPHLGDWERWGDSTFVRAELDAERLYRLRIEDGINMSYFAHFEPYTAGSGGGDGVFNRANITTARLLSLGGEARPDAGGDLIALDGEDDLGAFGQDARVVPGVPLQPWEAFAMAWDRDHLYVTVVSEAFEDPYKVFNLYMEASVGPPGEPQTSAGLQYSDLSPRLPFDATHVLSVRQLSDDGQAEGPWNGVFAREGGQWSRAARLVPGQQWWLAADQHTISIKVPLALVGDPAHIRVVGHVVNAEPANEWKVTIPAEHTPWEDHGAFLEYTLR